MVCFKYIIINTLHKGDNKDDNDDNITIHATRNVTKEIFNPF
jgi:hypothetical protein